MRSTTVTRALKGSAIRPDPFGKGCYPNDGTLEGFFVGARTVRTLRVSRGPEWAAQEKTPAFKTFEALAARPVCEGSHKSERAKR